MNYNTEMFKLTQEKAKNTLSKLKTEFDLITMCEDQYNERPGFKLKIKDNYYIAIYESAVEAGTWILYGFHPTLSHFSKGLELYFKSVYTKSFKQIEEWLIKDCKELLHIINKYGE